MTIKKVVVAGGEFLGIRDNQLGSKRRYLRTIENLYLHILYNTNQ
ncbi:hypothetical protein [Methanobrevibacter thaueri]|nr:hypothetical protein [Methanobrevibacter thaueri]